MESNHSIKTIQIDKWFYADLIHQIFNMNNFDFELKMVKP